MGLVPFDDRQRAEMAANLAHFAVATDVHPDGRTAAGTLKRAAVCLIVADDGRGGASVILTKRAPKLKAHSGQWAIPGGRIEAGETPIEAALREAHEEVNLELSPDAILGRLDDYPTRSGYLITPVVAWAPEGSVLTANPDAEYYTWTKLDHTAPADRKLVEDYWSVVPFEAELLGKKVYDTQNFK